MFKFLIALSSLLALSHAQVFSLGPCPNPPAVTNFTVEKLQGRWFQQFRYPSALEGTSKCVTEEFKVDVNKTITVTNVVLAMSDGSPARANGTLTLANSSIADFKLNKLSPNGLIPDNFKIIDTDYTGYYVVYSCQNFFLFHFKYVAYFTKDRFITPFNNYYLAKANAVLDKYGISRTNTTLLPVDMYTCPLIW